MNKQTLYEVGTFEKYEAGFHAFYRTLNKDRAEYIKQICSSYLPKVIELQEQLHESESRTFDEFYEKIKTLEQEIKEQTEKDNINIREWSKLHSIELREVPIDF